MESRFAARRELQQALLSWRDAAREEAGTIDVYVYEDVIAPGTFGLEVGVATASALEAHVRSDAFGSLLGALNILAQHVHMTVSELTSDFGPSSFSAIRAISFDAGDAVPSRKDLK